jgi:hypothetical protein
MRLQIVDFQDGPTGCGVQLGGGFFDRCYVIQE